VVAFGDALGTAVSLRNFPSKERLYSVGLGLRYQTLVGPVRVEYGRNVNPRPDDPPGTWQISIGYPF
jgi:outer membrane translocation and assembly module TamA